MSALVVTYNNAPEITETLDALLAQRVTGGLEVIVIDNASTDGTAQILAGYADRVTLVLRDTNSGYAAANNEALALSSGELVALVNPDCAVHPGCLDLLAQHLDASPGVALAGAMLENPDGTPQLFARRDVTLRSAFWAFTQAGERWDRRWLGGKHAAVRRYADQWPPTRPTAVDCPAAACVVLWRHLARPQLFSPSLPLLFNDAELYRRLRDKAYRLEVVPEARATHGYGTSMKRVLRPRMRAERLAALRNYVAPRWGLVRCALLWLLLVADTAWLLVPALVGRDRGTDRALVRGGLGALGLPGGARPWLTPVPGPRRRLRVVARRLRQVPREQFRRLQRRTRRLLFVTRLRASAWAHRVQLTVDVHPTADVRRAVLELRPRSRVALRVGPRSSIREGVVLRLGGELRIGANVDVRWGAVLNVKGVLDLADRVVIGRGASVHADGHQTWGFSAIVAEYVTVLDTNHSIDGSPVAVLDQPVELVPLCLGANAFVGAKATILPGASIGRGARVGAGVVLTRPLPDGGFARGAAAVRDEASGETRRSARPGA